MVLDQKECATEALVGVAFETTSTIASIWCADPVARVVRALAAFETAVGALHQLADIDPRDDPL